MLQIYINDFILQSVCILFCACGTLWRKMSNFAAGYEEKQT